MIVAANATASATRVSRCTPGVAARHAHQLVDRDRQRACFARYVRDEADRRAELAERAREREHAAPRDDPASGGTWPTSSTCHRPKAPSRRWRPTRSGGSRRPRSGRTGRACRSRSPCASLTSRAGRRPSRSSPTRRGGRRRTRSATASSASCRTSCEPRSPRSTVAPRSCWGAARGSTRRPATSSSRASPMSRSGSSG